MNTFTKTIILSTIIALTLAACGGGGASPPVASSNTLSGTAAVGSPITGGTISIICAGGSGIAPTITDSAGGWSASLSGQTLPCAVQVSGGFINSVANTAAYHSIASSAGTVNVTPVTDLVVANAAAAANTSAWFAGLTPAALANFTPGVMTASLVQVRLAFNLPALNSVDPITQQFVPASGDPLDDILTALQTAMTSIGSNFAALLSAAASPSFTPPTGFSTAVNVAYSPATVIPSITSFSPLTGFVGSNITIVGSNLAAVTQVLLTGPSPSYAFSAANIISNTGSSIVASVPVVLVGGSYTLSIVYAGGESQAGLSFTVTTTVPSGGTFGQCSTGFVYDSASPTGCSPVPSGGTTQGIGWTTIARVQTCSGVVAAPNTNGSIALSWPTVNTATNYKIHATQEDGVTVEPRSATALPFTAAGDLTIAQTSRTDVVSTTDDMLYKYVVTAYNGTALACVFPVVSVQVGTLPTKTTTDLTFTVPTLNGAAQWPSAASIGSTSALIVDTGLNRSTDGTSWTKSTPNTGAFGIGSDKIASSATMFITASGTKNGVIIARSSDALTWTAGPNVGGAGVDGSYQIVEGLTYTNGKFYLAVGYNSPPTYGVLALYSSSDEGVTWSLVSGLVTGLRTAYGYPTHIAAKGNTLFVYTGGPYRALARSTDGGANWSTVATLDGLPAIAGYSNETKVTGVFNGMFQGEQAVTTTVNASAIVRFYSADGLTWTRTNGNGSYVVDVTARGCTDTSQLLNRSPALTVSTDSKLYVACASGVVATTDGMKWIYIARSLPSAFEPRVLMVNGSGSSAKVLLYGRSSGVNSLISAP